LEENNSTKGDHDDPGQAALESLATKLANSHFSNVVVLIGAGASVSAGIPDFRTPGTGLYDRLQKYGLPYPEAIFDLDYYRDNPIPFLDLCKSIWPGQDGGPKPTIAHAFLKLLQQKKCLRRIYTQNIDGLEALAGVSTEYLVECHGHFRSASCISCHAPSDDCQQVVVVQGDIPKCQVCGSLVKPDIVFFGEELPIRFQQLVDKDVQECDLLLVMGTSLLVMPVARIPSWVKRDCPRVLLNRELVGDFAYTTNTTTTTTDAAAGAAGSGRDVYVEGDCDDSVKKICQLAGWEKELEQCHQNRL
jgi:NAD-dependent SIR2 family protein deacetylase